VASFILVSYYSSNHISYVIKIIKGLLQEGANSCFVDHIIIILLLLLLHVYMCHIIFVIVLCMCVFCQSSYHYYLMLYVCGAGEQGPTQFVFWLQQTFPRRGVLYEPYQLPWYVWLGFKGVGFRV
jgi:hypothetical protein